MVPDHIEIYDKSDHDLLVILVVRQNDVLDILEKVQSTIKNHADRLTKLEQHCADAERKGDCTDSMFSKQYPPWVKPAVGLGAGGLIISALWIVLKIIEASN